MPRRKTVKPDLTKQLVEEIAICRQSYALLYLAFGDVCDELSWLRKKFNVQPGEWKPDRAGRPRWFLGDRVSWSAHFASTNVGSLVLDGVLIRIDHRHRSSRQRDILDAWAECSYQREIATPATIPSAVQLKPVLNRLNEKLGQAGWKAVQRGGGRRIMFCTPEEATEEGT